MKAQELRIGNCVYDIDGDILQIDEINNEYVKFKNTSLRNRIHKIKPIPLTEEILLKCGFEKHESNNKYGWYLDVSNRHLVWCYSDFISIEFTHKENYLNYNDTLFDLPCKYLHQLQNLYFVLTNQELKIKI